MRKKLLIAGAILLFAGVGFASGQFVGQDFHVIGEIEIHDGDQGNWNDDIADPATILDTADVVQDVTWTFPDATSGSATIGEHTVSFVQGGTAADALDTQFFIADRAYVVTEINAVWGVAESTGAMDIMVERLQGTEACAAGDDLQAAVVDATATANTVTTPALTATTANLDLAAGNRLCVDLTATPNEVTNMVVTVTLRVD